MKIKYTLLLVLLTNSINGQSLRTGTGSLYQTYNTTLGGVTNSSIFKKPFQEFNYIKTHRGIEVYSTYNSKNYFNSTMLQKSIFSKPAPEFIITQNGNVYETYKYKIDTQPKQTEISSIFKKTSQKAVILSNQNSFTTANNFYKKTPHRVGLLKYDPDINAEPVETE